MRTNGEPLFRDEQPKYPGIPSFLCLCAVDLKKISVQNEATAIRSSACCVCANEYEACFDQLRLEPSWLYINYTLPDPSSPSSPAPCTFTMALASFWKRLSSRQLNMLIQAFSLISIFFEGYGQVCTPQASFTLLFTDCILGCHGWRQCFAELCPEVGIGGADGVVTNTTKQRGIVSIYYLGAIIGCFIGGWRQTASAASTDYSLPPCLHLLVVIYSQQIKAQASFWWPPF